MPRVNKSQGSANAVPRAAGTSTGAEKSAFVARLHTILSHWPSAARRARAMGVSPSASRKWLKGEAEPSRERLVALARAAGGGVAWLAGGGGPGPVFESGGRGARPPGGREPTTEQDWGQFVLLPHRAEAAAAGSVTPPDPLGTEWVALRHDWVR